MLNPNSTSMCSPESREPPVLRGKTSTAERPHLLPRIAQRSADLLPYLALVAAGVLYYLLMAADRASTALNPEQMSHLALNLICNGLVVLVAMRAHGPLNDRMTHVFGASFAAHGALALLILATRLYFSRPTLLLAAGLSPLIGLLVIWLRYRVSEMKVAIISGEQEQDPAQYANIGTRISTPDADLRGFDLLLVPFDGAISPDWAKALSRAMLAGVQVRHVREFVEETRGCVSVDEFDLDEVSDSTIDSYRHGKRLLDICLVVFLMPAALLILAFGMLGVMVSSGFPIFFSQKRVGLGGRVFTMYKLRTMKQPRPGSAESATVVGDTRITGIGRFLRRYRIDELPQLAHVLLGQMSLIGPRPEQPALSEAYIRDMPAFAYRHLVRPGITGWAQVRAAYAADLAETRTKLSYDLYYVKNLSLALDLQIIARTFWTLAAGSGVR